MRYIVGVFFDDDDDDDDDGKTTIIRAIFCPQFLVCRKDAKKQGY